MLLCNHEPPTSNGHSTDPTLLSPRLLKDDTCMTQGHHLDLVADLFTKESNEGLTLHIFRFQISIAQILIYITDLVYYPCPAT